MSALGRSPLISLAVTGVLVVSPTPQGGTSAAAEGAYFSSSHLSSLLFTELSFDLKILTIWGFLAVLATTPPDVAIPVLPLFDRNLENVSESFRAFD